MNLPLRAWKEVVTAFGMSRRPVRPKAKPRARRSMQLESLKDRRLMTTLHWVGGVTGTWDTTSLNWSNGSGTVAWKDRKRGRGSFSCPPKLGMGATLPLRCGPRKRTAP
jgi:hypothetical protein